MLSKIVKEFSYRIIMLKHSDELQPPGDPAQDKQVHIHTGWMGGQNDNQLNLYLVAYFVSLIAYNYMSSLTRQGKFHNEDQLPKELYLVL